MIEMDAWHVLLGRLRLFDKYILQNCNKNLMSSQRLDSDTSWSQSGRYTNHNRKKY